MDCPCHGNDSSSDCSLDEERDELEELRELVKSRGSDPRTTANIRLRIKSQETGYAIIYKALKHDYLDVVAVMLNFGVPVNDDLDHDDSPLHLAARKGSVEMVKLLLSKGAKVNVKNRSASTPLHYAVQFRRVEVVKLLLSHNAEVNAFGRGGTPLHYAALYDGVENVEIVELLLSSGADVNARFSSSSCAYSHTTPLHLAAMKGLEGTVSTLLIHGADVNSVDGRKETPLHAAAKRGRIVVVFSLLSHNAELNIKDGSGATPLYCAVTQGHDDIVSALLMMGSDVNTVHYRNRTLLHIAVRENNRRIVSMLVQNLADVNCQDTYDKTPLHYAVDNTPIATVKLALQATFKGAPAVWNDKDECVFLPNGYEDVADSSTTTILHKLGRDKWGQYDSDGIYPVNKSRLVDMFPLFYAEEDNKAIVSDLLQHGADVNIQDFDGKTVLHIAVSRGNDGHVARLLNRGAIINLKDELGNTALHYAADPRRRTDLVSCLLTSGADVNSINLEGESALHKAAQSKTFFLNAQVILTPLLLHGAYVNHKDVKGETALHIGARCGGYDCVRILLEHEADPNIHDLDGQTPFHYALPRKNFVRVNHFCRAAYDELEFDIVKLFLDYGAIVNMPYTARFWAHFIEAVSPWLPLKLLRLLGLRDDIGVLLSQHFVKLQLLNLPVDEFSEKLMKTGDWYRDEYVEYKSTCETELAFLKEIRLNKVGLSVCDLLTLKQNKLSGLARDEVILDFMTRGYYMRLPEFGSRLVIQFKKAKRREVLLRSFPGLFWKCFSIPPGVLVDAITNLLSIQDLQHFITAFSDIHR